METKQLKELYAGCYSGKPYTPTVLWENDEVVWLAFYEEAGNDPSWYSAYYADRIQQALLCRINVRTGEWEEVAYTNEINFSEFESHIISFNRDNNFTGYPAGYYIYSIDEKCLKYRLDSLGLSTSMEDGYIYSSQFRNDNMTLGFTIYDICNHKIYRIPVETLEILSIKNNLPFAGWRLYYQGDNKFLLLNDDNSAKNVAFALSLV